MFEEHMNGSTAAWVAFIWFVFFPFGLWGVDRLVTRIVWGKWK